MKSFKTIFIFSILTLALFSCKKEEDPIEETTETSETNAAPTIEIDTPDNHQSYSIGDTINIVAHFEDDKMLASYHVYIADEEGNTVNGFIFDDADDLDEDHHHYMKNIIIPDTAPMMFWIHFDLTDSDGEEAEHLKLMQHAM